MARRLVSLDAAGTKSRLQLLFQRMLEQPPGPGWCKASLRCEDGWSDSGSYSSSSLENSSAIGLGELAESLSAWMSGIDTAGETTELLDGSNPSSGSSLDGSGNVAGEADTSNSSLSIQLALPIGLANEQQRIRIGDSTSTSSSSWGTAGSDEEVSEVIRDLQLLSANVGLSAAQSMSLLVTNLCVKATEARRGCSHPYPPMLYQPLIPARSPPRLCLSLCQLV